VHWIDWIIIGITAFSTLVSLWRGFVREALSLTAWILAFVLATALAANLAVMLDNWVGNDTARYVASWIIIFIIILILGTLINSLMAQLIRATGLSGLDRTLGMVFGFARGVVIVLAIVYVVRQLMPASQNQVLAHSQVLPHLEIVLDWAQRQFGDLPLTRGITT